MGKAGSKRPDTRPVQLVLHQNAPRGHLQLTSVRPATSELRGTDSDMYCVWDYDVRLDVDQETPRLLRIEVEHHCLRSSGSSPTGPQPDAPPTVVFRKIDLIL
jgi:hypothetical protein